MAGRSLTATPDGIDQINRALTDKKWSRDDLANHCDCSRQPAVKFCSGKSVSKKLFVSFCEALDLDWENIAGFKITDSDSPQSQETEEANDSTETDIDAIVQDIRQKVHDDIRHRCGTMRVLDMEQPIGISDIYTNVNILEKLSGRRRLSLDELLQDCDLENFDRLMLGQIHHERVPGLEAVERYNKLIILGKPGAGKTTFMKRLATLCNQGTFQTHRVPVFVTLKEFADAKGQPDLPAYIDKQWQASGVKETEVLTKILGQGRALILFDGLDEVQEAEHDRILQEIKNFTRQFRDCQFVMTCRIAAREYTFQNFVEVEVADFDVEQITEFAQKWFTVKKEPAKGQDFIKQLNRNEPIQELATNPLLLTLLCLIFGEGNDFPANRAELYKEGLDILLKKWDVKRNIERDQVYKRLSLKRKEDLLSQLSFQTFREEKYFFKQEVIEKQILDYIRNLPGANEEEEALQLDSESILKSIESQHGLLVERARHIYSFSHLTFQEYFTARQITRSTVSLLDELENLVEHITEKRYREVFLLTSIMLPEADKFLLYMKQKADFLVIDDSSIQSFLFKTYEKSKSTESSYKSSSIRAFYISLSLARELDLPIFIDNSLSLDLKFEHEGILCHPQNLGLDFNLMRALDVGCDLTHDRAYTLACALARDLNLSLDLATELLNDSDTELQVELARLKSQIPSHREINFKYWWKDHGDYWVLALREVIAKYRNVGHDWQFTNSQRVKLHKYYEANQLLVECLNSDCYVTKPTRQYIEEMLLLPMSEIEKKNSKFEVLSENVKALRNSKNS